MSKEAMKLALEALEMVDRDDNDRDFLFPSQCYQLDEAITALREALANEALDRMAENARELGLDYEPPQDSGIVTAGGFDPRTQRTWVGLEKSDMPTDPDPMYDHKYFTAGMVYAANKLMEKNGG